VLGHERLKVVGVNRCSILSHYDIICTDSTFIIKSYSYKYLGIHCSCYCCQHQQTHSHTYNKPQRKEFSFTILFILSIRKSKCVCVFLEEKKWESKRHKNNYVNRKKIINNLFINKTLIYEWIKHYITPIETCVYILNVVKKKSWRLCFFFFVFICLISDAKRRHLDRTDKKNEKKKNAKENDVR